MKRTGVLLINLGTPDAPTPEAVGRYLRQFLMDGFVIDVPAPLRWFLVNVVIVPRRKVQSAKAYQKVQLPGGSPLLVYTRELAEKVAAELASDDGYVVEFAMRYGNPSISSALTKLKSADVARIFVLPLYPQYAESSYETAVVETKRVARELGYADRLSFLPPFYDRPELIAAFARRLQAAHEEHPGDHVVFSFHSLPERHIKRLDESRQHCLVKSDCCEKIGDVNRNCYRAQCFFTARGIAAELGLNDEDYTV
ncbi:MAG: protoporphyrin/coproporphyrin ferrochelatase, partial [Blastocatellia bacterium]|nr:protoporphyrin/coproporphyrin ferrochelatase [Blastocatellia bacterium]